MSTSRVAHDPSVADYRATSPRWRAGRNLIDQAMKPSGWIWRRPKLRCCAQAPLAIVE
jgi:hypothetical protein